MNKSVKEQLIFAQGLTRIYPMGSTEIIGVQGVDLEIDRGELVVLKGDSGSGKSTLLAMIAGLDTPTSGHLSVAGHDLKKASQKDLNQYRRDVVGMVFQTFNLLPTLTVLENVCLPALLMGKTYQGVKERAMELLSWLGLKKRLGHYPAQLSGGEMQRTAISRALINEPELILADEPTGNLDSRNGGAVVELMADLNRRLGTTIIIATHSKLADSFASFQMALKDGRIT